MTAGLSRDAVHAQVAAALHVVVHLQRDADGLRRVGEIGVLSVGRDGRVASTAALLPDRSRCDPARTSRPGARRAAGRCRMTGGGFQLLLTPALAGLAVALLLPPGAAALLRRQEPPGAAAPHPRSRSPVAAAASWRCSLPAPARACWC